MLFGLFYNDWAILTFQFNKNDPKSKPKGSKINHALVEIVYSNLIRLVSRAVLNICDPHHFVAASRIAKGGIEVGH